MVEDWAQIHAAEGDLTLILLPVPPVCWDYRLHHCIPFLECWGRGIHGLVHVRQVLELHPHTSYFSFSFFLNYFLCMDVLPACMTMYHLCLVPVEEEEAIRFLRVIDGYELQYGCWKLLWRSS